MAYTKERLWRMKHYAPDLYEALKGILLVATPIGHSEFKFEKTYFGKFEVHGNRLETALEILAKVDSI